MGTKRNRGREMGTKRNRGREMGTKGERWVQREIE